MPTEDDEECYSEDEEEGERSDAEVYSDPEGWEQSEEGWQTADEDGDGAAAPEQPWPECGHGPRRVRSRTVLAPTLYAAV